MFGHCLTQPSPTPSGVEEFRFNVEMDGCGAAIAFGVIIFALFWIIQVETVGLPKGDCVAVFSSNMYK